VLRELAVRTIKPLLSDMAWKRVRRIDPTTARRDAEIAARAARRDAEIAARAARRAAAAKKAKLASQAAAPPSLSTLAAKYGTDKWGGPHMHQYTPHYQHHLGHLRNERFTLLEIGIGGYKQDKAGGASLRMWKEFFPRAQIVGLDIEDKSFVNEDRIRAYQDSQTDARILKEIIDDADNLQVIIDDGSHRSEHTLQTFAILFPQLPDGGHYIIEDTQTSYWSRWGGTADPTATYTTMGFTKTLIDGLNYEEGTDPGYQATYNELKVVGVHAYHNMVFIDKGTNADGRWNTNRG